jgi:hypothetical protein
LSISFIHYALRPEAISEGAGISSLNLPTPHEGEWPTLGLDRYNFWGIAPGNHWVVDCMGFRVGVDIVWIRIIYYELLGLWNLSIVWNSKY